MANAFIGLEESATIDKRVDCESLTVDATAVHRERNQVAGAADDDIAVVTDATPGAADHGLVVRPIGVAAEDAALGEGILIQGDDGTDRHNVATDTAGRLQSNTALIAGVAPTLDAGVVAAGTQRVVLANDNPGIFLDGDPFALATGRVFMGGARVNGTLAALADADGDAVPLRVDANGSLRVAGVAAEATALGEGVLIQGDDGTDRQNIAVDTAGFLQINTGRLGGVAINTNGGVRDAATQTVTLADDDPATVAVQLIDDTVFADDAAFTLTSSKVMMAGAIVNGTPGALAAADGDAVPFRVNANGALHVTGGGGGTERADDSDTHAISQVGTAIMAVAVPADTSVDANDYGHLAMSTDRRLLVDADIVAGTFAAADGQAYGEGVLIQGDDGTDRRAVLVDTDGHVQVDIQSGAVAGTEREDDTDQLAATHVGTGIMGVATPTNSAVDADDYGFLAMSTDRRLHVDADLFVNGTALDLDNGASGTSTLRVSVANDDVIQIGGDVAHGALVSTGAAKPPICAAEARTTNPTAVDNGDVVRIMADDQGRQITYPFAPRDLQARQTTAISGATETTVVTAAASEYHDIVGIIISNNSDTDVNIDFREDTGQAVQFTVFAPTGQVTGFIPAAPLVQSLQNDNWTAQLSGAPGSGDVDILVQFIKVT